jgi:hypothetical protein
MSGKVREALVLLAEIAGLLAVFAVFLLILNFFSIISLPDFLPKNAKSTPTSTFTPTVDTSSITTRAPVGNINRYKTYTLPPPRPSDQDASWAGSGVFAGYGQSAIMLVSSNGTLVINFDARTVFEQVTVTTLTGSSGATIGFNPYPDSNSFIANVAFGKYIQVYYNQDKSGNNKIATKIDYISSYKF